LKRIEENMSPANTIITRLIGGLGNQLFQYAAARAMALKAGASVKLDLSEFDTDILRRYELGSYAIAAVPASSDDLAAITTPAPTGLVSNLKVRLRGAKQSHYREAHFHFDPNVMRQRLPLYMDGYWQSERYFRDVADTIRRDLTPRDPLEPENAAIAAQINRTNAVSLHVRRGDYVTNAVTNAYHGVCSIDYYRAAVAYITTHAPDPYFFVFSDDLAWARENLVIGHPTTFVEANPPDRGFRDMQLMSMCRHHVIANSSFSWWGAWLNPSNDKIIVAPARWFAQDKKNTDDLLPAEWVKL
jgi:hypothetical protein